VPKLKVHQVGQAGEHYVAAELHRRGAFAVTFSGNMPNIEILASVELIRFSGHLSAGASALAGRMSSDGEQEGKATVSAGVSS
jgi:hypothetical protein